MFVSFYSKIILFEIILFKIICSKFILFKTHSIRIVFEEEMMLPSSETPSMRMVQVEP